MKNFSYQSELQKIIDTRELVQVYLAGAPTFKVAYLLNANDDYLTFVEVSSSATANGVIICRMEDVDSICTSHLYLSELEKQIVDDSIYQAAVKDLVGVTEFTFDGFLSALVDTSTIVEITDYEETTFAGRVVGYDEKAVALDEYYTEYDKRLTRAYLNRSIIRRIAVDVPWLRTIARSLYDKNL